MNIKIINEVFYLESNKITGNLKIPRLFIGYNSDLSARKLDAMVYNTFIRNNLSR